MEEYELRRTVWDARVPIEFSLEPATSTSLSAYAMLPRISYFPLCLAKPLQFLSQNDGLPLAAEGDRSELSLSDSAWLESRGHLLKWHYPIGVLYDLHSSTTASSDAKLPWRISLRLKDFPAELIQASQIKHCFLQSLKEADHVKHKGKVVQGMTADEHQRLFDCIVNDRFDDFWSVNRKLMGGEIAHVPIRFYQANQPFRQVLIPRRVKSSTSGEEHECLLSDAIARAFPREAAEELIAPNSGFEAISHGIALPWSTPVLWLAKNLSYPDNFVHVVLRSRVSTEEDFS